MGYNAKNYTEQGGEKTVIGGTLEILPDAKVIGLPEGEKYTLPVTSAGALGGVRAAAKGTGDTVPVKVDSAGNMYVPTYPTAQTYTLPVASASVLGGVRAAAKGTGDTVPVKVDANGNLYVPTYPTVQNYTLPVASSSVLGGVKAAAKGTGDTVAVKADSSGNLYVPTYPTVPTIPVAANQAASTAADVAGLLADFNALLAKLKAAGLMTAD